MKKYLAVATGLLACQIANAGLESPANGETKSGIGLIRGWVCDANEISISINNKQPVTIAYKNPRGDTSGACGDTDNGFETLWNWNNLGDGQHTITAYADGTAIGTSTFNVVTLGLINSEGEDITYVRDLSASYALAGFPEAGKSTELSWSEKDQNFIISDVSTSAGDNVNSGAFNGVWEYRYDSDLVVQTTAGTENGNSILIATVFHLGTEEIEIYSGPILGSSASVSTLVSGVNAVFDVTLVSSNQINVKQVSCSPSYNCDFTNGTLLQMDRLY